MDFKTFSVNESKAITIFHTFPRKKKSRLQGGLVLQDGEQKTKAITSGELYLHRLADKYDQVRAFFNRNYHFLQRKIFAIKKIFNTVVFPALCLRSTKSDTAGISLES